jgi:hypothetical protein
LKIFGKKFQKTPKSKTWFVSCQALHWIHKNEGTGRHTLLWPPTTSQVPSFSRVSIAYLAYVVRPMMVVSILTMYSLSPPCSPPPSSS